MDRVLEKKRFKSKNIILFAFAALLPLFYFGLSGGRSFDPLYSVDLSSLKISTARNVEFARTIQVSGFFEPSRTVRIEAVEEGIIAEILKKDGSFVGQGETILVLENENLQRQLSFLKEELAGEKQNFSLYVKQFSAREIDLRDSLLDLDFKIGELYEECDRNRKLFDSGSLAEGSYRKSLSVLEYWREKREILLEKIAIEKEIAATEREIIQMKVESALEKIRQMEIRTGWLEVRAAESGTLRLESLVEGQSLPARTPLGKIDSEESFKLIAYIDEYYLPDIAVGDRAGFSMKSEPEREYKAVLRRISPRVEGKRVALELSVPEIPAGGVISGQNINIVIYGENPVERLAVDSGAFMQDSGGNWVFRIEGDRAVKVPVHTGIRNRTYVEILEGLIPGDRIIVSPYKDFLDYDRLRIKEF